MFVQEHDHVDIHKEAGTKRVAHDEADVQKLVSCFTTELMASPFAQESESLVTFDMGVVLPNDRADGLIRRIEKGRELMNTSVCRETVEH